MWLASTDCFRIKIACKNLFDIKGEERKSRISWSIANYQRMEGSGVVSSQYGRDGLYILPSIKTRRKGTQREIMSPWLLASVEFATLVYSPGLFSVVGPFAVAGRTRTGIKTMFAWKPNALLTLSFKVRCIRLRFICISLALSVCFLNSSVKNRYFASKDVREISKFR